VYWYQTLAEPKKIIMPSASFIVARSNPGNVIGCENKLPWNLKTDMRRFRKLTEGHVVIMGRRTLESIGRPLPNRKNIVLSKGKHESIDGVEWVSSAEDAIFLADFHSICMGNENFFVIGGGEIYKTFYEKDLYSRLYLTEVFHDFPNGDSYFPYDFDGRRWATIEEVDFRASELDQYPFRFVTLEKRSKTIRTRFLTDFMTNSGETKAQREQLRIAFSKWEKDHPSIQMSPEIALKFAYKQAV
jgi:dihydrofolate reductase